MENQSHYDPSRKTVGAIYRDAQINNSAEGALIGDISNKMMQSLVDDINATVDSNPFNGLPFYITVHESRDLMMPNCFRRRMIKTKYRPYPEDDTVVFFVNPRDRDVRYCWCLPHWSNMSNVLRNFTLYDAAMVTEITAWKNLDLFHFGFIKDPMGNWMANPSWEDKRLGGNKIQLFLPS